MISFGPVPSRRLGRSLGINNIPPKICTYSCSYCQVGRTHKMQVDRKGFYNVDIILKDVRTRVEQTLAGGDTIDYLAFVPDGEPTLDINLGLEIEMLSSFGIKTAVITNASLLWREDVRNDLLNADWISVKVDSIHEDTWRKINRPHRSLKLDSVLKGILEFAKIYRGELTTETMLVKGCNEDEGHLEEIADYISKVKPDKAYISIPTRPPAESSIQPPDEVSINQAYQIFCASIDHVEYLIGYEGNAFASTGNIEEDILSITAVHPMRKDAVMDLLDRSNGDWEIITKLLAECKIAEIEHAGNIFYLRTFPIPGL